MNRSVTSDSQLLHDYLQSTGVIVDAPQNGGATIASFQNVEGQAEAVVISGGSVYHACREPLSDSGWNIYGVGSGFKTFAALDASTLWASGYDGALWRSSKGRWTDRETVPDQQTAVAVATGKDGTVWASNSRGQLLVRGKAGTQPSPAFDPSKSPVLLRDASDCLNVFCVDTSGLLWTIQQTIPGAQWSRWMPLNTPQGLKLTAINVAPNHNGALQVFAVGSDQRLYTLYQQQPGGAWSGWTALVVTDMAISTLTVATNADGRLEIFAFSPGNAKGLLWHAYQHTPSGPWSDWTPWGPLPFDEFTGLSATLDQSGCLNLALSGMQYGPTVVTRQSTAGGTWTDWVTVGISLSVSLSQPCLLMNADGHLELFMLGSDNNLYHTWQAGSPWVWDNALTILASMAAIPQSMIGLSLSSGRLQIFVLSNGQACSIWQDPNGEDGWSYLTALTPASASGSLQTFAASLNAFGAIEVVALGSSNTAPNESLVWQTAQTAPTAWSNWASAWWNWYPVPGAPALLDGAAGMPSGTATNFRAITASGAPVSWSGTGWTTLTLPPNTGTATCLAVDDVGATWIMTSTGALVREWANALETMPGPPLPGPPLPGTASIGAGSASALWALAALDPNKPNVFSLHRYINGAWEEGATPGHLELDWNNNPQISVGRDGSVWLLDGSGNLYRQERTLPSWSWDASQAPAGTLFRFLSAAPAGNAWAIDTAGTIWQFQGRWTKFNTPLPSGTIAQISLGAGNKLWAIDSAGTPYRYDATGGWQAVGSEFAGPLVQSPTTWAIEKTWAYEFTAQTRTTGTWHAVADWTGYEAAQVSVGSDGTALLLDGSGALHVLSGNTAADTNAPPGLFQIAVVTAARIWGAAQDAAGAYRLHLFNDGAWTEVATSGDLFASGPAKPQLSSAGDGTVWLLDTGGAARRLTWSNPSPDWQVKGKMTGFQSVAAANVSLSGTSTPHIHEAWSVTNGGLFRHSFGERWWEADAGLPHGATARQVSVGTDGSIFALDTSNTLHVKQVRVQGPEPAPATPPGRILAAALDQNHNLDAFSIDAQGTVWTAAHADGQDVWTDWTALGGDGPFTSLATGLDQNGTIEVFCLSEAGVPCHAWKATDGSWYALIPLASGPWSDQLKAVQLGTGNTSNGLLSVFALTNGGGIYVSTQNPGADWSNWAPLPPSSTFVEFVVASADYAFQIIARDAQGYTHASFLNDQGTWEGWYELGAPGVVTALATGLTGEGALWLLGAGTDGAIYAIIDPPTMSNDATIWRGMASALPGVKPRGLSTCLIENKLSVFMEGADGAIYAATVVDGTDPALTPLTPLGGVGAQGAPLGCQTPVLDSAGAVHLLAAGGGSVWHNRPASGSTAGWSDWARLSGRQAWTPLSQQPFAQAPAGSLTADAGGLWAVFKDGTVHWSADGIAWSDTHLPGGAGVSVSVGLDGMPYAVSETQLYAWASDDQGWTLRAAQAFAHAPVGRPSDLWAIDPKGALWRSRTGGASWWPETSFTGKAAAVSMCVDGGVWVLDTEGVTSLAAGWARIMRPTGMTGSIAGARQLVAGQDETGTRHIFYLQNDASNNFWIGYVSEIARHAWFTDGSVLRAPGLGPAPLTLTNQQDTGDLIVYQTSNFTLLIAAKSSPGGAFSLNAINLSTVGPADPISSLELVASRAGAWTVNAASTAYRPLGGLFTATFAGPGVGIIRLDFVQAAQPTFVSPLTIVPLPWTRTDSRPYAAFRDASNQLWIMDMQSGACLQLDIPGGIGPLAPIWQADRWTPPQPRFYAMAEPGLKPGIWARSRIDLVAAPTDPAAWTPWIPLGGSYSSLAVGPALTATDALFGIGDKDSLAAIRQNPMSGVWTQKEVNRPSWSGADMFPVLMYHTEATFLDSNNLAEAGVTVTVFAESPVEAWINNTLYPLDPEHGITVKTNAFGKLVLKTMADHLHAPTLTFQLDGLASQATDGESPGVSVSPSQRVYGFLQGTGTLPVGGGKTTLLNSTALQSLGVNATNAPTLASDMQTIANLPGKTATPPPAAAPPHRAKLELGGFFDNIWDDVKHAAEAVAHAVEQGIVSAAVTIENDTVTLSIAIGNAVQTAFTAVIKVAQDAIRAIETIVMKYVTDLVDFIKWLALLFDWAAILAAQKWLKGKILQSIDALQIGLGKAETSAASAFASINNQVSNVFDQIIGTTASQGVYAQHVAAYTNLGQMPNQASSPSIAKPPPRLTTPGTPTPPIPGSSPVLNNWLFNKVMDHIPLGLSVPQIPGLDLESFLEKIDIHSTVEQLIDAATDLVSFCNVLFTDPGALTSTGVTDLVRAAKHLVLAALDLFESLIEAFLAFAQGVAGGLAEMLQTSIDIPLVDTLFSFLTDESMDILSLTTLVAAIPFHMLYDILFDSSTFPPNELEAIHGSVKEWANIYLVLGVFNAAISALSDVITIAQTPDSDATAGYTAVLGPTTTVLSFLTLVTSLVMQVADWPDSKGFPFFSESPSEALVFSWINWAMYFGPPVVGMLATGKSPVFSTNVQTGLNTTFGLIATIASLRTLYENYVNNNGLLNPEGAASMVVSPLGLMSNVFLIPFLRTSIWNGTEDLFDPAILVALIDLISNLAGPILDEVSAYES